MKQENMERMFGASISVGRPRRTETQGLFHAKAHHLWCRRCLRVFQNGVYRSSGEQRLCPYADCQAREQDARAWGDIRGQRPNYPDYPTLGVRYPEPGG